MNKVQGLRWSVRLLSRDSKPRIHVGVYVGVRLFGLGCVALSRARTVAAPPRPGTVKKIIRLNISFILLLFIFLIYFAFALLRAVNKVDFDPGEIETEGFPTNFAAELRMIR